MASANFNGLAIVYGEDIRSRVKECKFHFKQSVERISRTLGQKREEFKNLALNMLTSSTPEAYSHAIDVLKIFSKDNAYSEKKTYFARSIVLMLHKATTPRLFMQDERTEARWEYPYWNAAIWI